MVQSQSGKPTVNGEPLLDGLTSGTGKTCVFALGALQTVKTTERDPQVGLRIETPSCHSPLQVLILSPTRELAEQSQKVCLALGDYMNVQVGSSADI